MADIEKIEQALREHIEKHKDRERAMFTVAGVSAIISQLSRLSEAEKRLRGALERIADYPDHQAGSCPGIARRALQGGDNG